MAQKVITGMWMKKRVKLAQRNRVNVYCQCAIIHGNLAKDICFA
jgi:hypothetical protein